MTEYQPFSVRQTEYERRFVGHAGTRLLAEAGLTMSVRDFSRVLGCHPQTVYDLEKRGGLAALGVRVLSLGRRKRVVTADVRRLVGIDTPDGAA
jgi:hypothetical protein